MRPPLHLLPLLAIAAACAAPAAPIDAARTERVATIVRELGPDVRAGVWLAPPRGDPLVALAADEPLPVASAIKVAFLVELFAQSPQALDAPLPGAADVIADEGHPAVAHFTPAQRATAAGALGSASVRRVGEAMITGKGVDNATYNLAANLVTAHFGGPTALAAKLHARDRTWRALQVQRYMLADRVAHGDNLATARSLAAVHGMLAQQAVPGVDPVAVTAARAVLARPDDDQGRHVFAKGGSLDSDPVTRVEAGWREGANGSLVHVVMLAQGNVAPGERFEAGRKLAAAAQRIVQVLVE